MVHGMCNFSDLPLYVCSIDCLFATRCLHQNLQGDDALAGEFDDYVTEVFQVNGFKTDDDVVAEAKN